MEPTSEPVERADDPSSTVVIRATGSRIRIRRIGVQLRMEAAR